MSNTFSSQTQGVRTIDCLQPELTIGFPRGAAGPNSVVLANGAVVDLNLLGQIISKFCPEFACPQPPVVFTAAPAATAAQPVTQPFLTDQNILQGLQQAAANQMVGGLMAQAVMRDQFDLRDGPGPDQLFMASMGI